MNETSKPDAANQIHIDVLIGKYFPHASAQKAEKLKAVSLAILTPEQPTMEIAAQFVAALELDDDQAQASEEAEIENNKKFISEVFTYRNSLFAPQVLDAPASAVGTRLTDNLSGMGPVMEETGLFSLGLNEVERIIQQVPNHDGKEEDYKPLQPSMTGEVLKDEQAALDLEDAEREREIAEQRTLLGNALDFTSHAAFHMLNGWMLGLHAALERRRGTPVNKDMAIPLADDNGVENSFTRVFEAQNAPENQDPYLVTKVLGLLNASSAPLLAEVNKAINENNNPDMTNVLDLADLRIKLQESGTSGENYPGENFGPEYILDTICELSHYLGDAFEAYGFVGPSSSGTRMINIVLKLDPEFLYVRAHEGGFVPMPILENFWALLVVNTGLDFPFHKEEDMAHMAQNVQEGLYGIQVVADWNLREVFNQVRAKHGVGDEAMIRKIAQHVDVAYDIAPEDTDTRVEKSDALVIALFGTKDPLGWEDFISGLQAMGYPMPEDALCELEQIEGVNPQVLTAMRAAIEHANALSPEPGLPVNPHIVPGSNQLQ